MYRDIIDKFRPIIIIIDEREGIKPSRIDP